MKKEVHELIKAIILTALFYSIILSGIWYLSLSCFALDAKPIGAMWCVAMSTTFAIYLCRSKFEDI